MHGIDPNRSRLMVPHRELILIECGVPNPDVVGEAGTH